MTATRPVMGAVGGGGHGAPSMGMPGQAVNMQDQAGMMGDSQEPIVCMGCKVPLEETSDSVVVMFGQSLWHVDCFRCTKCNDLVEHDTNLLLLSDGTPVCETCSYICSVCKTAISNEAIVTGDESYHADCFKCRSCHTHIKELIFAKTSQGIYCMDCHNQRVARSRRGESGKRSKSSKKDGSDKERRPGSSGRSKSRPPGSATASSTPPLVESIPNSARAQSDSHHHSNPRTHTSRQPSSSSVPGVPKSASTGAVSPPGPGPTSPIRHPTSPHAASSGMTYSPSLPNLGPSRNGERSTSSSSRDQNAGLGLGMPGYERERERERERDRERDREREKPLPTVDQTPVQGSSGSFGGSRSVPNGQRRPTPREGEHDRAQASPAYDSQTHSRTSSSAGARPSYDSLAAPSESRRNANRRSGFYGLMANQIGSMSSGQDEVGSDSDILKISLPSSPTTTSAPSTKMDGRRDASSSSSLLGGGHQTPSTEDSSPVSKEFPIHDDEDGHTTDSTSLTPPPVPPANSKAPSLSTPTYDPMARSMSYYDPDLLLYLDDPTTPEAKALPKITRGKGKSREPDVYGPKSPKSPRSPRIIDPIERLSPSIPHSGGALQEVEEMPSVVNRVRESLRRSRAISMAVSSSSGNTETPPSMPSIGVDLDLVESLLKELESTKEQMKDLQTNYRRASRQVYEGFNMAREEYDKEVIARREVEAQVAILKQQLVEQASKLAEVNATQKQHEHLQQQTHELRSHVDGMEKHLSKLKIERDLTVAEMEELKNIGEDDDAKERVKSLDVGESLASRLEGVKDEYRKQITELAGERDALLHEIEELRQVRDVYNAETSELNAKNNELAELNRLASNELDTTREQLAQLQKQAIARSGSISRSPRPSAPASRGEGPPLTMHQHTPSEIDAPASFAALQKVENIAPVPAPAVKKFKWGKGKVIGQPTLAPVPPPYHPQMQQLQSQRGPPQRMASSESSSRSHIFHPTSILRPVRCEHCGDKMWGLQEYRCAVCGVYCHARCSGALNTACAASSSGSNPSSHYHDDISSEAHSHQQHQSMFGNDLVNQARFEDRKVPTVVVECIAVVEQTGMEYEGIYRKSGGAGQIKHITALFERGDAFNLHDSDQFNDISAVTSVLKNYFRGLPNPLFTAELHEDFLDVVDIADPEKKLHVLEKTLSRLPDVHYATLQALMVHLHHVSQLSDVNKMNPPNLGVVFGPTLLRSANPAREFSDMPLKSRVVEFMVERAPHLFGGQTVRAVAPSEHRHEHNGSLSSFPTHHRRAVSPVPI